MTSPRASANLFAVAGIAGLALLYRFSPQQYSFYPRCPFFALTHHYCPGCGATRAVAELLHGNIVAALHFNAAVALLFPIALCYLAGMYWTALRQNRFAAPPLPALAWKTTLALVMLFGFVRAIVQSTL